MIRKITISLIMASITCLYANTLNPDIQKLLKDIQKISSALKETQAPKDSLTELKNKTETIRTQTSYFQANKRLSLASPAIFNKMYKTKLKINISSLSDYARSLNTYEVIHSNKIYTIKTKKFCKIEENILNQKINKIKNNIKNKKTIKLLVSRLRKLLKIKNLDLSEYRNEISSIDNSLNTYYNHTLGLSNNNIPYPVARSIMQEKNEIILSDNELISPNIKVLKISNNWIKIGLK